MTSFLKGLATVRRRSFGRPSLVLALLLAGALAAPAAAVLPPRYGASLIVASRGPVTTIDPVLASSTAERDLVAALFDRLVEEGPDSEPVAAAAESWVYSDDGRTVTFTLRPGLRFSNGRPVTARDFESSWARIPAGAMPHAGRDNSDERMGGLQGRALDDRTLVVTSKGARDIRGIVLDVLSDPLFSVVLVVNDAAGESLLGSGPFRFGGQSDGGFVLLPRFDHPLGRPSPARVLIAPYADDAAGRQLLGGLAVARHDESATPEDRRLVLEPGVRGLRRTSRGVLDLTLASLLP